MADLKSKRSMKKETLPPLDEFTFAESELPFITYYFTGVSHKIFAIPGAPTLIVGLTAPNLTKWAKDFMSKNQLAIGTIGRLPKGEIFKTTNLTFVSPESYIEPSATVDELNNMTEKAIVKYIIAKTKKSIAEGSKDAELLKKQTELREYALKKLVPPYLSKKEFASTISVMFSQKSRFCFQGKLGAIRDDEREAYDKFRVECGDIPQAKSETLADLKNDPNSALKDKVIWLEADPNLVTPEKPEEKDKPQEDHLTIPIPKPDEVVTPPIKEATFNPMNQINYQASTSQQILSSTSTSPEIQLPVRGHVEFSQFIDPLAKPFYPEPTLSQTLSSTIDTMRIIQNQSSRNATIEKNLMDLNLKRIDLEIDIALLRFCSPDNFALRSQENQELDVIRILTDYALAHQEITRHPILNLDVLQIYFNKIKAALGKPGQCLLAEITQLSVQMSGLSLPLASIFISNVMVNLTTSKIRSLNGCLSAFKNMYLDSTSNLVSSLSTHSASVLSKVNNLVRILEPVVISSFGLTMALSESQSKMESGAAKLLRALNVNQFPEINEVEIPTKSNHHIDQGNYIVEERDQQSPPMFQGEAFGLKIGKLAVMIQNKTPNFSLVEPIVKDLPEKFKHLIEGLHMLDYKTVVALARLSMITSKKAELLKILQKIGSGCKNKDPVLSNNVKSMIDILNVATLLKQQRVEKFGYVDTYTTISLLKQ